MTAVLLRPLAEKFSEFFKGNENCYGIHVPSPAVEGEKAKGKSFTKKEALGRDGYLAHLHGEQSIGIVPIRSDGTLRFAAIDVDVYPLNPIKYIRMIEAMRLPFIGFRSKSGGLHLYVFFKTDADAQVVIRLVRKVRILLGLPDTTEIFPKQTKLTGSQMGNWINLPYYKAIETERYAYDAEGGKLSLEEALHVMTMRATTERELEYALEEVPFADAPPCIQTTLLAGGAPKGHRNEFLFDVATYLKAKYGDDYEEHLIKLNETLDEPIQYAELLKTTISSQNKGTYAYRCKSAHLQPCCDKPECSNRRYGKGGVSNVSFERFIMVEGGENVYFKWTINGVELTFYGASELRNQSRFIEKCIEQADVFPRELNKQLWEELLQRTFANKEVVTCADESELSVSSLWKSKFADFLASRPAIRAGQVEEGLVFYDETDSSLHFKGAKLYEYFAKSRLFTDFKKGEHGNLLKQVGAEQAFLYMPEYKRTKRTWKVDLKRIQEALNVEIDVKRLNAAFIEDGEGEIVIEDFTDKSEDKF